MRDYSELEIFEGNPLDKWNDIIFHASKKLSKKELERLLELLALLETFIEKEDLEEKFESFTKALRINEELQQKIESRKTDIVIQSMANILSGNEWAYPLWLDIPLFLKAFGLDYGIDKTLELKKMKCLKRSSKTLQTNKPKKSRSIGRYMQIKV